MLVTLLKSRNSINSFVIFEYPHHWDHWDCLDFQCSPLHAGEVQPHAACNYSKLFCLMAPVFSHDPSSPWKPVEFGIFFVNPLANTRCGPANRAGPAICPAKQILLPFMVTTMPFTALICRRVLFSVRSQKQKHFKHFPLHRTRSKEEHPTLPQNLVSFAPVATTATMHFEMNIVSSQNKTATANTLTPYRIICKFIRSMNQFWR